MNDQLLLKRDNYIRKLVSNARAILANQIAIPLGALKMGKIIYWINNIQPLTEIDLQIFLDYNNKTAMFPVGTDRLYWNKESLKLQDKELDKLTLKFKEKIIDKCFDIINKLGDKN